MNKSEQLINAVKTFQSSNQNTEDYLDFAMVIQTVTRQGSGLMWSQIQDCVDIGLSNKKGNI